MRKYNSLKEIHDDVEPIVQTKLPLSSVAWTNIVNETIRFLGEDKERIRRERSK